MGEVTVLFIPSPRGDIVGLDIVRYSPLGRTPIIPAFVTNWKEIFVEGLVRMNTFILPCAPEEPSIV